jgi:DNA-binding NtrC family response regulator
MTRQLNILVVDDDMENADSLAELFQMENHRVVVAYDGQQAVDAFSSNTVDIGFFDVMMPNKNGVDSFMEIKAKFPEARVYFMTGYSAEELIDTAMNRGALGVFSKPVDLGRLLETVESEAA